MYGLGSMKGQSFKEITHKICFFWMVPRVPSSSILKFPVQHLREQKTMVNELQ